MQQIIILIKILITGCLNKKKIKKIQDKKLKHVLISAYKNIPYYTEIMTKVGYNPVENYKGIQDLNLLPVLTKKIFKERAITDFIHKDYCDSYQSSFRDVTSGSTGIPMTVYRNRYERYLQIAKWLRVLFYNGYSIFDKVLSFTSPGRLNEGNSFIQKIGLFRRMAIDYTLPIDEIMSKVENYQPDIIYGNKASFDLLCNKIKDSSLKLKFIVVGGEIICSKDKSLYERTLRTRVVESYGSVELGIIAFQQMHQWLRLNEDLTYYEFIEISNKLSDENLKSKLVMTDLSMTLMPLIRYDLGDFVIPKIDNNSIVGITKIYGRQDDKVYLENGEVVNFLVFYEVIDKYMEIKQIKIFQKNYNFFEILIVINPEKMNKIKARLVKDLTAITLPSCQFEFEILDEIPIDANGKNRFLVSEIK